MSSLTEEVPGLIKGELVAKLSINARVGVLVVAMAKPCWMDPIIDFLAEDRVSVDEKESGQSTPSSRSVLVISRP